MAANEASLMCSCTSGPLMEEMLSALNELQLWATHASHSSTLHTSVYTSDGDSVFIAASTHD
jgi:hypothetical protein